MELTLASDRPAALVCVRLCDVAPDGSSLLVTRGLLNLTHRDGHERPEPLVPGERYTVTVRLNSIAHAFAPGHRLRVAVSPTYWPWAWPSPDPVTLTVEDGLLRLPARAPQPDDDRLAPFAPPEAAEAIASELEPVPGYGRVVAHDVATGRYEITWGQDFRHGSGSSSGAGSRSAYTASTRSRSSTAVPCRPRRARSGPRRSARDDWRVRIEVETSLSADAETLPRDERPRCLRGRDPGVHESPDARRATRPRVSSRS